MLITAALMTALAGVIPSAQVPAGPMRDVLDRVGLTRIADGDPPITTSLDDALTAVDLLDGFEPTVLQPLRSQSQDLRGAFHVGPGVYAFAAASYCLHAGTHGPGTGEGYLSAPLEGPRREAVRAILQNSVAHPEIDQPDIQVLLWGILARTRIRDLSRPVQAAAARLLTPAQLFEVNGGALGLLPEHVWRDAGPTLPPAALRVLEGEARLRQLLTSASAAYAEIERMAVLPGDPAADPRSGEVPRGRWSYHPDGYFIRFFPGSYSRTEIQVYVPKPGAIGWELVSRPSPTILIDLSEAVAVPGHRGRQRLGLSGRSAQ